MAKQTKKKRNFALPLVVIWTVVMLGLAAYCYYGGRQYYDNYMADAKNQLAEAQAQAESQNAQLMANYQQALAQFETENSDNGGANLAWPMPKGDGWEVMDLTNYPLEGAYAEAMTRADAMNNGMLLVNEFHSRPDDFDDTDVISIQNYSKANNAQIKCADGKVKMFPVAIDALMECVAAAKEQGYENYVPWYGYRTWDEQNEKFQAEMARHADRYSGEALLERTKKSVNYPGTSEYNSGLGVNIKLYKSGDESVNSKVFFESEEGIWMYNHSWEYGLVFRFPLADYPIKGTSDKSYKTGMSSKQQIFRYVGKGNAAAMHTLDFCLEEYIEYLMEHPHLAVFNNGQLKYEIYREYVGDASNFQVTLCAAGGIRNTVTSLDNMGYVISVFEY